jgi:hypothetical protein
LIKIGDYAAANGICRFENGTLWDGSYYIGGGEIGVFQNASEFHVVHGNNHSRSFLRHSAQTVTDDTIYEVTASGSNHESAHKNKEQSSIHEETPSKPAVPPVRPS